MQRVIRSFSDRLRTNRIFQYIIYLYIKLLFKTYRIRLIDNDAIARQKFLTHSEDEVAPLKSREGLYCIWHEHIIAGLYFLNRYNMRGHLVADGSSEGMLAHYISQKFNYRVMIGDRKPSFIRRALEVLDMNKRLFMVGDGGIGPAEKLQREIPYLCAKTGVPLVKLSVHVSSALSLYKRWDNLKIPLPFSRIEVTVHEPVYYYFNDEDETNIGEKYLDRISETEDPEKAK